MSLPGGDGMDGGAISSTSGVKEQLAACCNTTVQMYLGQVS